MTGYPWATGDQLLAADLNAAIAQSAPPPGTTFLATGGGTMTGPLILSGNATLALQAVPLQQMNAAIAGVSGVSSITAGAGLTGGTITTTGTIALATPVGLALGGTGATTPGAGADNLHGFSGTAAGIVRRTGTATYSLDAAAYITSNQTITLTGDITGSGATSIAATVTRLQGQPVASATPTTNQVLQYSGAQWAPVTIALPPTAAAPTATVSGSTVTGSATTYMRSDAAPALANTAVAAGSYTYSSLTVDAQGRLTAASSGTAPAAVATTTPAMNGTAAIGSDTTHFATANHVHPTDTSLYPASNPSNYQTAAQVSAALGPYALLASPTFSGTPSLPTGTIGVTQTAGNSSTALATTAFVASSFAPLASPTFTGTPTLPTGTIGVTQTAGTSNTTLATTAFVGTALGSYLPLTGGTLSNALTVSAGGITVTGAATFNTSVAVTGTLSSTGATNLNTSGGQAYVGSATATQSQVLLQAAIASQRGVYAYSGASLRWAMIIANNTGEGGSNAGSDFSLYRYSDTAGNLGVALGITRSTGVATFQSGIGCFGTAGPTAKPTISGACAGNTAIKALLTQLAAQGFLTDSTTA